ncbi:MAG: hypothetical protein ACYCZW_00025 [Minisyncoccota bacterium]
MRKKTVLWSDEEIESLVYQMEEMGLLPSRVKIVGRSSRAIDHQISALRKKGVNLDYILNPWTTEEDGKLLIQIGIELKNLDQIKIDGRTEDAIYSRIKVLRKHGFNIKPVKRLQSVQVLARMRRQKTQKNKEQIEKKLLELKKLLYGEGKYWPSEYVANKLGCKSDWVGRWRKRLGIELVHSDAMSDPIYRKNFLTQVSARLGAKINIKRRKIEEERDKIYQKKLNVGRLEELFRKCCIQRNDSQLHQCSICKKIYYASETFFIVSKLGQTRKFGDICLACHG